MAVGGSAAERWNGKAWFVQKLHFPDTPALQLGAVSCASASACTAIGTGYVNSENTFGGVERWNGKTWSPQRLSTAKPNASVGGVSCPSNKACTIVGGANKTAPPPGGGTLAERWNGINWSIQPTANATDGDPGSLYGAGALTGVSCTSGTTCMAVGYFYNSAGQLATLAERYG
jgi:hypothetical protein